VALTVWVKKTNQINKHYRKIVCLERICGVNCLG